MNGKRDTKSGSFTRWAAATLLWIAGSSSSLFAQNAPIPIVNTTGDKPTIVKTSATTTTTTTTAAATESEVVQTGCSSCSKGLLGGGDVGGLPPSGGGCGSCGSGGCASGCYAGRYPCDCCVDESTFSGRLLGGLYKCICCPDPCYEPRWNALADAAFYSNAPRPVTQMKLRYDHVWNYSFPDKSEFLWARSGGGGKGPGTATAALSYRSLVMYNEVGIDRFSASVAIPYLQMSPDAPATGASGFGDITIGTKSLLLDCELIQFAFAFNTIVPSGNFTKGLGTGHVSLEPAFLMALKLAPVTYLQSEVAYRIPIGGDAAFQGPVLHYHFSLNHLLWSCGKDIKLIGTAELNGYELCGGAFRGPGNAILSAKSIATSVSIGPGVRMVICDKIDFGVGSAFNITEDTMGNEMIRAEFRWRF